MLEKELGNQRCKYGARSYSYFENRNGNRLNRYVEWLRAGRFSAKVDRRIASMADLVESKWSSGQRRRKA